LIDSHHKKQKKQKTQKTKNLFYRFVSIYFTPDSGVKE